MVNFPLNCCCEVSGDQSDIWRGRDGERVGRGWAVEYYEVAAVDGGGDGLSTGFRSFAAGSGEPGLIVGIEVAKHQGISIGGEQGGEGVFGEGVSWAAGCGRDVNVEDVEWGAPDGDGDPLDLEVTVGGVGGESGKGDGVVDEEGETAPCVSLAVFSDKVVALEGWDG